MNWRLGYLLGLAAGLYIGGPNDAHAHNLDCNNDSVPTEMKSGCCGKEDYRALKPNQVRAHGDGYDVFLDGKWRPVVHDNQLIIAQPTGAPCWGVWYRQGKKDD